MNSPYKFTPAVKALCIANGVVFIAQLLPGTGLQLTDLAALIPVKAFEQGQVWRCATYMFFHSTVDIFHLLLNLLALWMFGGELERMWGAGKFWGMYFLFGIGAGFFSALYLFDPALRIIPVIGASGAIFGLLTAYAVYYPNRYVLLFFILPVRAWMVVAGFAVLSLMFAFSRGSGIAHLVHLGGIVTALAYMKMLPRLNKVLDSMRHLRGERSVRRRAEESYGRKRYYEEKVDPILEKISREGEGSLTEEEKRTLEEVWKYKGRS